MPKSKGASAPSTRSFPQDHYVSCRADVQDAVVNIHVSGKQYDFAAGWNGAEMVEWTGSGFCIDGANFGMPGERFIMTNTHVAENSHLTQVRLALDGEVYNAEAVFVGEDVDIGLLRVVDTKVPDPDKQGVELVTKRAEDFWKDALLLEFGDGLNIRDKVCAYGFPMGGAELAITEGRVSRMEVGLNVVSDIETLVAQWEGAQHPGNSGGPVISDKTFKISGIVHQGRDMQGGGEFIPLATVKHVMKDWERNGFQGYKGFPGLAMSWDLTKNDYMRAYLGMPPGSKGIQVREVPKLSAAAGILQTGDVITKINGIPIDSDGTFFMESAQRRISYKHILHESQIGDDVELEILRKDKPTDTQAKPHNVKITLQHRVGGLDVVSLAQSGQKPRFYRHGGMVFVPLTGHFYAQGLEEERPEFMVHHERAKKSPDEEIILLQKMVLNRYTQGYDTRDYENRLVKSINGKPIHKMQDVVDAFEQQPEGKMHEIRFGGEQCEDLVVIPWLSEKQRSDLLEDYHVAFDRSEELRSEIAPGLGTRIAAMERDKAMALQASGVSRRSARKAAHKPAEQAALHAQLAAMDQELDDDDDDADYNPAEAQDKAMEVDLEESDGDDSSVNSADFVEDDDDRDFIDDKTKEGALKGSVLDQPGVQEAIGSRLSAGAAFTASYAQARKDLEKEERSRKRGRPVDLAAAANEEEPPTKRRSRRGRR